MEELNKALKGLLEKELEEEEEAVEKPLFDETALAPEPARKSKDVVPTEEELFGGLDSEEDGDDEEDGDEESGEDDEDDETDGDDAGDDDTSGEEDDDEESDGDDDGKPPRGKTGPAGSGEEAADDESPEEDDAGEISVEDDE